MGSVVRRVLQKLGEDGDLIWDVVVGRRDVGGLGICFRDKVNRMADD